MDYPDEKKIKIFQDQILAYWDCCGRKELPWRKTSDPWKILLTEILLRKTTAQQVLGVYKALTSLSPAEISQLSEDKLKSLLFPLGMYRVKAVQILTLANLVAVNGKEILRDSDILDSISGIGRYIKNAVRCFAFGEKKPAADTNMIRVIQRVFSFESRRSRAREDPYLWAFAEKLVPDRNPKLYNWSVLDLAWAVCKPKKPACPICPLRTICDYSIIREKASTNSD